MSKPAPKPKVEKGGRTPSVAAVTPVAAEIVPGKMSEADWLRLSGRDDSNEFIKEIIEEVYMAADQCICQRYMQRQIIPFTVSQAQDAIVQIIEWYFLAKDDEPSATNPIDWSEDTEPGTCVIDCWAQGCVPRLDIVTGMPTLKETIVEACLAEDVDLAEIPRPNTDQADTDTSEPCPDQQSLSDASPEQAEQPQTDSCQEPEESSPTQCDQMHESPTDEQYFQQIIEDCMPMFEPQVDSVIVVHPYQPVSEEPATDGASEHMYCPVQGCVETPGECPIEACVPQHTEEQTDPSNVSITYIDYVGPYQPTDDRSWPLHQPCTVVPIAKIPPHKLPSNRVDTTFAVLDTPLWPTKFQTGNSNFNNATKGRKNQGLKQSKEKEELTKTHLISSSMIDSMEVSSGVIVRDMNRVKKGPKQPGKHGDLQALQRSLQPIKRLRSAEEINICDLLDHTVPIIRPLHTPTPVPPIGQGSPAV